MTENSGQLRVRNKGLRRVRVADLEDAPWNPRIHPDEQRGALSGAVTELGFYSYPDCFLTEDGKLMLCDGHLRKSLLIEEYGEDTEIEVNVTDFTEMEARKATLTKDPLAAMAETDAEKLDELMRQLEIEDDELRAMVDRLDEDARDVAASWGEGEGNSERVAEIPEIFEVVVQCADERDQKQLFQRLTKEGRRCRLLNV